MNDEFVWVDRVLACTLVEGDTVRTTDGRMVTITNVDDQADNIFLLTEDRYEDEIAIALDPYLEMDLYQIKNEEVTI